MLKYWKWQDIVAAIVILICGFLMLMNPEMALSFIAQVLGILLIAVGIIFILAYFLRRKAEVIGYDLIIGVVIVGLGIFVCLKQELVASILPVILGICIVISGVLKIQRSLDLKRMEVENWGYVAIMALISVLLGTIVILRPFSTAKLIMRLVGISFIYSGITDLITAVIVSIRYSDRVVNGTAVEQEPDITLEETPDNYYDADAAGGTKTGTGQPSRSSGRRRIFGRPRLEDRKKDNGGGSND